MTKQEAIDELVSAIEALVEAVASRRVAEMTADAMDSCAGMYSGVPEAKKYLNEIVEIIFE